MKKPLIVNGIASTCYFRTSVEQPYRKALLQITERCDLHCAHCFVSAGDYGDTMRLEDIRDVVIPRMKECRVVSVTLTGGEPFVHPAILEIVRLFRAEDFGVGICTNGTSITLEQISWLASMGGIHVNVSLDGFSADSHGKFRGNIESFYKTVEIIKSLSMNNLLQGILVTPNGLAKVSEYVEICDFAAENRAKYVLMNPLSRFGRGVKSQRKLAASSATMERIRTVTASRSSDVEVVYIRFPNRQLPLAPCVAGTIIYIFTRGAVTICPYLVFAATTPGSKHSPREFIVGNIFDDPDIARRLDDYRFHDRYHVGSNPTCRDCHLAARCGKGCPAAVIASGDPIGQVDREVCPIVTVLAKEGAGVAQ